MAQSSSFKESFTEMPRLTSPMVDPETGIITQAWYRLILALFVKLGGTRTAITSFVYVQSQAGTGQAFNSVTGASVPLVAGSAAAGLPAVVQALTVSPFSFVATVSGTLTIYGGQIEMRRGVSGAYRLVGLTGGAFRLLPSDSIRVTWFSALPPDPVVWYPDA